jgi:NAD(P)-dependent dehydrogenase (short-subunit alcohol dehydrogenase family)
VAPGPVETDIAASVGDFNVVAATLVALTRAADRVGSVEDIADIVLLIANERSRWITGQHISASGGVTGQ